MPKRYIYMTGAIIGAYIENMSADFFNRNVNINLTGSLLLKITFSEQLKQNAHFSTGCGFYQFYQLKKIVWQHKSRKNTKQKNKKGAEMYYYFEYSSGANPYIAKTEKERDRIIKKHEKAGEIVNEIKPGFYIIGDAGLSVRDLSRDQLTQVKQSYYITQHESTGTSYGELAAINELVTDNEIFEAYEFTIFNKDDFFN